MSRNDGKSTTTNATPRTESFHPEHPELLLDLVYPESPRPSTGWPMIVWLHGGGWRLQDRLARPDFDRHFASAGFAMVSIDYRLAPEHPHPAQLFDLRQALRYFRVESARLGLDPARIGLWGSSAGGHVAAMAALTGHVALLDGETVTEMYAEVTPSVACVVEGYGPACIEDLLPASTEPDGPTEETPREGQEAPREERETPEQDLLGGIPRTPAEAAAQLAAAREASPVHRDASHAPPFFVLHGTADRLVPASQSEALYSHLAAAGREVLLYLVEGFGHGFLNPGEVLELGPGVQLDNGRLEREPEAGFTARRSVPRTASPAFDPRDRPASHALLRDFFAHHLQNSAHDIHVSITTEKDES